MLDDQQVADGQNGTVPMLDSSADGDEAAADSNAEVSGDTLELAAEPVKSETEKKTD